MSVIRWPLCTGLVLLAFVGPRLGGCQTITCSEVALTEALDRGTPATDALAAACRGRWVAEFDAGDNRALTGPLPSAWQLAWSQACPADPDAALWSEPDGPALRRQLHATCAVDGLLLGQDAVGLVTAQGSPRRALLLGSALAARNISDATASAAARSLAGPWLLAPPGAQPRQLLQVPSWKTPHQTGTARAVSTPVAGDPLYLTQGDTYGALWAAVEAGGEESVLVASAAGDSPGEQLVSMPARAVRPGEDRVVARWDERGVTLLRGNLRLHGAGECGGAALCGAEAEDWQPTYEELQALGVENWVLSADPDTSLSSLAALLSAAHDAGESFVALAPPTRRELPATLHASEDLLELLVPLDQPTYRGAAIGELFATMRPLADRYCAMTKAGEPFVAEEAHLFADKEALLKPQRHLNHLKTGCFNYFRLNDYRPDLDFHVLKALLPEERFDCYSVGMLQPFMMHNILQCETLTFIDFDWRIQDAQHTLLELYEQRRFEGIDHVNEALKEVTLSWIAKESGTVPPRPATLSSLCNSGVRKTCEQTLRSFQDSWWSLQQARFSLSAMHDTSFSASEATPVFFMSNASERAYTRDGQFRQLVERAAEAAGPEGRAVLIHHVGGASTAGFYEVRPGKRRATVKTLCRDEYRQTGTWATGDKMSDMPLYDIYLDDITSTREPRLCASLKYRLPRSVR